MFRDGIKSYLNHFKEIKVSGEASNGVQALELLNNMKPNTPDVLVVDIAMPRMNGIALAKVVKERFPNIKILVLTQYLEEEYIKSMISAGVDGYAIKSAAGEELVKAIHDVMESGAPLHPAVAEKLIKSYQKMLKNFKGDENNIRISSREREILKLLADGLSSSDIAKSIFVSIKTVELHRRNLLKKFGAKNTAQLIKISTDLGYL